MPEVTLERRDGIAYREALPDGWDGSGPTALMVHGYPESSYRWRDVLPAVAAAGYRGVAPDLPGFGDSPPDLPGTWERQVEAVDRFRRSLDLDRVALCVDDWGGLIGLRWACDNPDAVTALVISSTGFFSDGKWHGLAVVLRTEGQGEELLDNFTREAFGAVMREFSPAMPEEALDEYWKVYGDADRRQGQLDLYRSGDFEQIEPYQGRLGQLGVPTLILWGEKDEFAPLAGGRRLNEEIPGSELVVIEKAGHFLADDDPQRVAGEIAGFLQRVRA